MASSTTCRCSSWLSVGLSPVVPTGTRPWCLGDLPLDQPLVGLVIDLAVLEWRDQCRERTLEHEQLLALHPLRSTPAAQRPMTMVTKPAMSQHI